MATITYTFTKNTSPDGFKLSGSTPDAQHAVEPITGLFLRLMKVNQDAAQKIPKCHKFTVTISTGNTPSILVLGKISENENCSYKVSKFSPETLNSLGPILDKLPPPQAPAPEQPRAADPSITAPIQPLAPTNRPKPPGLYNPNTNCFMNATFQMVMHDTELQKALYQTFSSEHEKCKAEIAKINEKIRTLHQQMAEIQNKYQLFYWLNTNYKSFSESLEQENGNLENKTQLSDAYDRFFKALAIFLDKDRKETIDLTPLRHLLTIYRGSGSTGQCDAEEFFNALFSKVDLSKYKIGYGEAFERTYAPLDPNSTLAQKTYTPNRWSKVKKDDLIQLQPGNKTKNPNGINITLTLDIEDSVKEAKVKKAKTKEAEEAEEVIKISGQELLDKLFAPRIVKDPESPTACTDGYYVMQTEKKIFEKPPQRFLVHLKRFTFSGVARKIDEPVSMPELITIEKQDYRLKAIVYHLGGASGGHYIAYLKKDKGWLEANDRYVGIAEQSTVDKARENGYLYLYEAASSKMEAID